MARTKIRIYPGNWIGIGGVSLSYGFQYVHIDTEGDVGLNVGVYTHMCSLAPSTKRAWKQ